MVRTPEGCVLDDCTKFEADSSIRSKVIRGSQNFEIGSRDLSHAPFHLPHGERQNTRCIDSILVVDYTDVTQLKLQK